MCVYARVYFMNLGIYSFEFCIAVIKFNVHRKYEDSSFKKIICRQNSFLNSCTCI